jgi:hypothetical protein
MEGYLPLQPDGHAVPVVTNAYFEYGRSLNRGWGRNVITITTDETDEDEPFPVDTGYLFRTNETWFCAVHPTNSLQRGYAPIIRWNADSAEAFMGGYSNYPNAVAFYKVGREWPEMPTKRKQKQVLFCPACRQAREKWYEAWVQEERSQNPH